MDVNLYLLLALLATLLVIAYLLTRQPPCTCTGKRHDKANLL